MSLRDNHLTGEIPAELGQLANLRYLSLYNNQLAGPIPPELGRLANLRSLLLYGNQLTGKIPPELGRLAELELLKLESNQLTGSVPPELGNLANLTELGLSHNGELTGALPLSLVGLNNLEQLTASGTMLCAPSNAAFQAWLGSLPSHRVSGCDRTLSGFYLTQAVQSREFPVPLVAGEPALLRVFVTAPYETSETIPPVRARFFHSGAEVHVAEIPRGSQAIPVELDEGYLGLSANIEIPGGVIQEGLEMVIEVDPDGLVDPALGVRRRIPETGRAAVDVNAMPRFDLTLIPFLWTEDPDSSIIATVQSMAGNPEQHELFADTRTLLPVADMAVTARAPVLSSSNSALQVLIQAGAIRRMEGGSGYYMGMMTSFSDVGGVAYKPSWASASMPINGIIAHELGHNMRLSHAPCGGAGNPDPSYPYGDGNIGAWGFDRENQELVPPSQPDLMSYCGPEWTSDYHFTNALRYRLRAEAPSQQYAASPPTRTLLAWGGADADSVPFLDPAFVVDATPTLPPPGNDYTLTARTTNGGIAFSYTFDMPQVADGEEGRSGFVFTIPAEGGWATDLASIALSGPGGTVVLDSETDTPMAILRDRQNGQVRGFLRGEEAVAALVSRQVADDALRPGIQSLFSRGLPR